MNEVTCLPAKSPILKTKSQVFDAAHDVKCFYPSFGEALKQCWKFYKP